MSLHVFTDDRLLVVAANVVPLDSVPVEVVQHCHAGLRLTVLEMYLKTENSDYAVKLIHSYSSWLGMQNYRSTKCQKKLPAEFVLCCPAEASGG